MYKRQEQQVDAQALIDAIEVALASDGDLLSSEEQQALQAGISALGAAIAGDDVQILRSATDTLGKLSEPFAERRMNRSVRQALQGKNLEEFEE